MNRARTITFQRSQLYEQVWSTPIAKLANEYGLSDNGLRKVCLALDVPLPPRGHWAKLAAGQRVNRTPLTDPDRNQTFVSRPPIMGTRPFQSADDDAWLAAALQEELARAPIQIDPSPSRWHPALAELRKRLIEDAAHAETARRDHEKEEARRLKNPRASASPNFSGYDWRIRHGGIGLLLSTHKAAAIRVTTGTYKAALALLNAVFRAADARGVQPFHDEKRGRFVLQFEETCIQFAVRERLEDEWRDRAGWNGTTEKEKYSAATGRLLIAVYKNGYDSRQVTAEADGTWTNLSAALFQPLYRKVVLDREQRREAAERERRQELYRAEVQRQQEQRAKREERARSEKEEEQRLIAEARNWELAQLLRAYIAARIVQRGPEGQEWAQRANSVADRLDPFLLTAVPQATGSEISASSNSSNLV